jgi:hypothetical protein
MISRRVIAANPAAFGGVDALDAAHARRGRGLPAFQLARLHDEMVVDSSP